jgi:hypothetical protein
VRLLFFVIIVSGGCIVVGGIVGIWLQLEKRRFTL